MPREKGAPSEVFRSVMENAKKRLLLESDEAGSFEQKSLRGDERAAALAEFFRERIGDRFEVQKGEAIDCQDARTGQLDFEGAWAANLLGLSTQVPAKIIYLTDGPTKEVEIGRRSIHFKHVRPKAMTGPEGKLALVVQALRHLGKENMGTREIGTIRAKLSPKKKDRLLKDTRFSVDWIYDVAKQIAEKSA